MHMQIPEVDLCVASHVMDDEIQRRIKEHVIIWGGGAK